MAAVYSRLLAICAGEDPQPYRSFFCPGGGRRDGRGAPADRGFWQDYLSGAGTGRSPHPTPDQSGHRLVWSSHTVGKERSYRLRPCRAAERYAILHIFSPRMRSICRACWVRRMSSSSPPASTAARMKP